MHLIITKKNNSKGQKNSITGDNNIGNQIADSIVNINSSDLTSLMKRQEELRAEKWAFGYSEKKSKRA